MASELKPCPFCHKTAHLKIDPFFEPSFDGYYGFTVVCSAAGFDNTERGCRAAGAWGETEEDAATSWNTRPTPVAPVSPDATDKCGELVTVGEVSTVRKSQSIFAGHVLHTSLQPGDLLVTRSQAEELLAAKDDECKDLESTLTAWFNTKKITEDSLKPLMVAAVKGYLRTCSSGGMPQELIDEVLPAVECMIDYGVFAESVTQYTMSLKSDNAALTARVEELIGANIAVARRQEELANQLAETKDDLEAKLAAAEKILLDIAAKSHDPWASVTAKLALTDSRAALGGKAS